MEFRGNFLERVIWEEEPLEAKWLGKIQETTGGYIFAETSLALVAFLESLWDFLYVGKNSETVVMVAQQCGCD